MVDPRSALIKLTARQLMIESEKIVSNQTEAVYATITTGFSKMYRDASILIDSTKEFSTNGFPEWMNIDPYITVNIGTRYQIINLLNQINYGYKSKGRFKSLYIP